MFILVGRDIRECKERFCDWLNSPGARASVGRVILLWDWEIGWHTSDTGQRLAALIECNSDLIMG